MFVKALKEYSESPVSSGLIGLASVAIGLESKDLVGRYLHALIPPVIAVFQD